jgi:S-adenosylmethionine decarboxylase
MSQVINFSNLAGSHILIDVFGCKENMLIDENILHDILVSAVKQTNATIIASKFHKFGEQCGVTGILILAESHCSIHTWPELELATIDIYMCGDNQPLVAGEYIIRRLQPTHYKITEIHRGKGIFITNNNDNKIVHETLN